MWKLYELVYQSEDLECLIEGLEYGHTSLRMHLLIIVNLIVQEWLAGRLTNLSHGRDSVKQKTK